MNAIPELDLLLEPAFRDMREAVRSAFEIGRRWGRQEAAQEMKAKLAAALDIDESRAEKTITRTDSAPAADSELTKVIGQPSATPSRAARGSVRPAVMGLLAGVLGATQAEIVQQTGMNENSVRGLLNTLRNEGLAEKNGDVWSLTEQGEREVHKHSAPATKNQNTEADDQDSGKVPSSASALEEFG